MPVFFNLSHHRHSLMHEASELVQYTSMQIAYLVYVSQWIAYVLSSSPFIVALPSRIWHLAQFVLSRGEKRKEDRYFACHFPILQMKVAQAAAHS